MGIDILEFFKLLGNLILLLTMGFVMISVAFTIVKASVNGFKIIKSVKRLPKIK